MIGPGSKLYVMLVHCVVGALLEFLGMNGSHTKGFPAKAIVACSGKADEAAAGWCHVLTGICNGGICTGIIMYVLVMSIYIQSCLVNSPLNAIINMHTGLSCLKGVFGLGPGNGEGFRLLDSYPLAEKDHPACECVTVCRDATPMLAPIK